MITPAALAELPGTLGEEVARRWEAFQAAEPALATAIAADPLLADSLPVVWGASEYLADLCQRRPKLLADWVHAGQLAGDCQLPDAYALHIAADLDEAGFMAALREFRHRHMLRIAWRDLAGWATLDESLLALSALADACIRQALAYSARQLATRHGWPEDDPQGERNELMVVAMGKLGASELNFSSDVDLVFLYPGTGTSDGAKPLEHEAWFTRQARHCIRLLNDVTADGFVFRVDVRLRPFGDSGPLVISLAALEAYLQGHGRDWERYAWVKARALSGSPGQQAELTALLRPFIYRRYLDYGVFESLRAMKNKVARMSRQKARQRDLKLGPGGIREIEFVVQCYQLIRGGSEPALRTRSLLTALRALVSNGHLDEQTARLLEAHYGFLRALENRLQAQQDRQVHELPADDTGRARLVLAMGAEDWPGLSATIRQRCEAAHEVFQSLVFGPAVENGHQAEGDLLAWDTPEDQEAAVKQMREAGFSEPQAAVARLVTLRESGLYQRLDTPGRERLDRLLPALLNDVIRSAPTAEVLGRVTGVLEAVGRRSSYFALLNENRGARQRLVSLCARSRLLAEEVAAHPVLLDELIDPRVFEHPPTRQELVDEMARRFEGVAADDLEAQMEALRRFQRASTFRIALADLNRVLPLMKVSDCLTELAEQVLHKVLALAGAQMAQKFGLDAASGNPVGFAVIAYGKLGGLELGYGSDLDLVFVYSHARADNPDLPEASVFCTRLAQRIVHMLSTQTRSGRLYEVDTRLRPSGKSGLLVSEIEAFADYQRKEAWTWEHQALLRARWVAGDAALGERFARLRESVLCQPREPQTLQQDIVRMRERMRKELDRSDAESFDLKQGRGGLTDIEFLVQFFVLREAAREPGLVRWSDNIRQLADLAAAGIISAETAEMLADIYRRYRKQLHRLALDGAGPTVADSEWLAERKQVNSCWAAEFGSH